jgi:hypothetical protein
MACYNCYMDGQAVKYLNGTGQAHLIMLLSDKLV